MRLLNVLRDCARSCAGLFAVDGAHARVTSGLTFAIEERPFSPWGLFCR